MHGVPVGQQRPWTRVILGAVVALIMIYVVGSSNAKAKPRSAATSAELQTTRMELALKKEELRQKQNELGAAKEDAARLQRRLDELTSEHAKAHVQQATAQHIHEEMRTHNPIRDVLHPKVGRNEVNKWSNMKLDRAVVRDFARVGDLHHCRAHSFSSYFNVSDPLCTLDISQHLKKIPLNVTITRENFDIFHYVSNCPPLLARQICDLGQGYSRLTTLMTERSQQTPLPAFKAGAAPIPSEARLAFVILAHRADFLLTTSVEALEKLLRRLVHPNDVVVLHLDRTSGGMFAEVSGAMVMAENFTSVVREIIEPYCITPGGANQVEAQLAGFRRVLALDGNWTHVVYLSGLDFPLRTRDELAAYLRPGVSYFTLKELTQPEIKDAYEQYWREWWTDCPNPTGNQLFSLARRSLFPGLTYAHSDNVYVLSRELAEWLTTDEFAQLLWLYFRTTRHAQEYYLPTAIASDRRFLDRIERKSITLFEIDTAPKSLPVHATRNFKNSTADQEIIRQAHLAGEFFFVHRPRPALYKFIDSVRDPSFTNTDPPPAKGHEH